MCKITRIEIKINIPDQDIRGKNLIFIFYLNTVVHQTFTFLFAFYFDCLVSANSILSPNPKVYRVDFVLRKI